MAKIFDLEFSNLTREGFFEEVQQRIVAGDPQYVVTPNLDFARLAATVPQFRKALDGASMSLCDGAILYALLKLKRDPVPEKLSGSDLTPALLEFAEKKGHKVYLFGSDEDTLKLCEKRFPNAVVGWESPPFHPRLWEEEERNAETVKRIQESGADMVFVALGAQKQEYWAQRFHKEHGAALTFCIGASLDFISERVKRAPKIFSSIGLEWAWRLAQEPGRLWKRYFGDAVFLLRNLPRAFARG